MSEIERQVRGWWARLLAWLRGAQGGDAARKGRKAKEAIKDLRDSEAVGKARDAAKDVLRDLREGDTGRKAKEAIKDLRDGASGRGKS